MKRKEYVCLDYEKRCLMEKLLKAGFPKNEISDKLGVTVHTINYELRKNHMTAESYDAEMAQKYKILKGRGEERV